MLRMLYAIDATVTMTQVYGEPCDEMQDSIRLWAPVFLYIGIGSGVSEFSKVMNSLFSAEAKSMQYN